MFSDIYIGAMEGYTCSPMHKIYHCIIITREWPHCYIAYL